MLQRLGSFTILAGLAFTLAFSGPASAAGQTARTALNEVLAAGKKWQADAVIVGLSSVTVQPDGTASSWKYSFYSPRTPKRCVVTADASGVRSREVSAGYDTQPLGEFIDSDRAMQEAKKNGLKGKDPNMGVKWQGSGATRATTWIVNGGTAKGDVSVSLDARTGRFIVRNTME
jgi:hypothetical protein